MIGRMLTSTGRRAGRLRYETKQLRNVTILIDLILSALYNETTIRVDTECSFFLWKEQGFG